MPKGNCYVFDANTIVSAVLLPQSVPRQALDKALNTGKILMSPQTAAELENVLSRPKLDRYISETKRLSFMVALVHSAEIVIPTLTVAACRDPKDDMYLDLAVSAQAACVVTGDSDLLDLGEFRGVPIITARKFLDGGF